jgi:hypothetical protein
VTLIEAFIRNLGTCSRLLRKNGQVMNHKAESTDVSIRGGTLRNSKEVAVMTVERRGEQFSPNWVNRHWRNPPMGMEGDSLSWTARAG